ncbi:MAG TPA: TadE/TadG family type IV pilus assembly protein [Candidatus Acidoferrum sp.]|nr:TadE/TadG family type IV pilus assembly protein [Candidatus Acidoferrum sp.]
MRTLRGERGTAAVELVLLAPVLVLLIAVVVAAGRMVETKSAVLSVAREAARAGSEAPDAATAYDEALDTARDVAAGLGLDPARLVVSQDSGGFRRGAPYVVSVSYEVPLGDLPGLGLLPGSVVLGAEHAELIQRFKSRLP